MPLIKYLLVSILFFSEIVHAKRNEIREVFINDKEMKTVNLTMGRSTIISFMDKPVKVVAGNSNYFNIEYVGNDLTIQPLAKVDTNLFVYSQNKNKYGFQLKVGGLDKYDDMIYVRRRASEITSQNTARVVPQIKLQPFTLKLRSIEVIAKNLIRLEGTKTYVLDFELKNKGSKSVKLNQLQVFVSKSQERLKGQQVVFDKDVIMMHEQCRGRLFFSSEKVPGIVFYVTFNNLSREKIILKKYL